MQSTRAQISVEQESFNVRSSCGNSVNTFTMKIGSSAPRVTSFYGHFTSNLFTGRCVRWCRFHVDNDSINPPDIQGLKTPHKYRKWKLSKSRRFFRWRKGNWRNPDYNFLEMGLEPKSLGLFLSHLFRSIKPQETLRNSSPLCSSPFTSATAKWNNGITIWGLMVAPLGNCFIFGSF